MNCPCGSGVAQENCHNDVDINHLRQTLKRNIIFNDSSNTITGETIFRPKKFNEYKFDCELLFTFSNTPAGLIVYPLLITNNNKSIRPLTIDGITTFEDFEGKYIIINCMLTPISRGTIHFNIEKCRANIHNTIKVNCDLTSGGDPFSSIFALEHKRHKIALYHHTSEESKEKIISSGVMLGSRWSFQGTNELDYINYIYLTDLPIINDNFDLMDIGMTDKGNRLAVISDFGIIEKLEVYRDNPTNRKASLKIWVEPEILAANPLILHGLESNTTFNEFGRYSWWELFCPSIYRVPIKVKGNLPLESDSKNKNFFLKADADYSEHCEFLAGHGEDRESILRLWCEEPITNVRRETSFTHADFGLIDDFWVDTWDKNLAVLVRKYFDAIIFRR